MNDTLTDELPFLKLKKFEYNEGEQSLDIEFQEDPELCKHVGGLLKLEGPSTHEQATTYFAEIIAKALSGEDGYAIEGLNSEKVLDDSKELK